MAGRRPFSAIEERKLLKVTRQLCPRDRAFVSAQQFLGFRLSETLRLRIGDVLRDGELVDTICLPPRSMKGGFGRSRRVPVLPELNRAFASYLGWLRRRLILQPDMPLFFSRVSRADGSMKAIGRERARLIIKRVFARAGIFDDGRLGSHSYRKRWAMLVYKNSGNCALTVKAALNHSSLDVTQAYLSVEEEDVMRAIRGCDFTREPRAIAAKAPASGKGFSMMAA